MQRTAVEQTKAVFGPLRRRIEDSVTRLEEQIAIGEENGAPEGELEAAREVLKEGQKPVTNGN
jgi:tubulin-specific chaperone A